MPIGREEWQGAFDRSQENPLHEDSGVKRDIAEFLQTNESQAFTLTEINENIEVAQPSGDTDGIKRRVGGFIKSAAKKRYVKYFLNQLVAEGHVETKIKVALGNQKVYYRWRKL